MQTIVIGNTHGLRPDKHVIATAVTRADTYLENGAWHSAAGLPHGTVVQAVNHFGRHVTTTGEELLVRSLEREPVKIRVREIRLVEVDRLTDADFRAMGYKDRADYQADWGEIMGNRVWLMEIKRLDQAETLQ